MASSGIIVEFDDCEDSEFSVEPSSADSDFENSFQEGRINADKHKIIVNVKSELLENQDCPGFGTELSSSELCQQEDTEDSIISVGKSLFLSRYSTNFEVEETSPVHDRPKESDPGSVSELISRIICGSPVKLELEESVSADSFDSDILRSEIQSKDITNNTSPISKDEDGSFKQKPARKRWPPGSNVAVRRIITTDPSRNMVHNIKEKDADSSYFCTQCISSRSTGHVLVRCREHSVNPPTDAEFFQSQQTAKGKSVKGKRGKETAADDRYFLSQAPGISEIFEKKSRKESGRKSWKKSNLDEKSKQPIDTSIQSQLEAIQEEFGEESNFCNSDATAVKKFYRPNLSSTEPNAAKDSIKHLQERKLKLIVNSRKVAAKGEERIGTCNPSKIAARNIAKTGAPTPDNLEITGTELETEVNKLLLADRYFKQQKEPSKKRKRKKPLMSFPGKNSQPLKTGTSSLLSSSACTKSRNTKSRLCKRRKIDGVSKPPFICVFCDFASHSWPEWQSHSLTCVKALVGRKDFVDRVKKVNKAGRKILPPVLTRSKITIFRKREDGFVEIETPHRNYEFPISEHEFFCLDCLIACESARALKEHCSKHKVNVCPVCEAEHRGSKEMKSHLVFHKIYFQGNLFEDAT